MTDSDFNYTEASAKRKKRNQLISIVIVVAILLVGVIVWGWIELEKRRNAERIKSALTSQLENTFPESVPSLQEPYIEPVPEEISESGLPAEPEPTHAKPAPTPVPKVERKPVPETKPVPERNAQETSVQKPIAKPEPIVPAVKESKTVEPLAMMPPKVTEPAAPQVEPPKPAPVFPPEDLPMPAKPEISEEARGKLRSSPETVVAPAPTGSETADFATGMAAYRQQDFHNAVKLFANIPKPATKQRGNLQRDEFVQANYFRALSLQKTGRLSEAASAYGVVLEYEKYHPIANMNLGICYVELKQYAKAHRAFESVVRDQSFIEPEMFDDVMQRTRYFWALAWTRMHRSATNPEKQNFYRQQAVLKWKDYLVWFSKNDKYKQDNLRAENYLKSLGTT